MDSDNISHLSDEHLAEAGKTNTTALEILMQRYKNLVRSKAKPFFSLSGDKEDLIQEGMIGLYKAVLDFDHTKGSPFLAFAQICIIRQIQTAVKLASRKKHSPLNHSISLDTNISPQSDSEESYLAVLPDKITNDPEVLFLSQEAVLTIDEYVRENLSTLEYNVLIHHIFGESQTEIAEILGKSKKSIDNTLQRVKKKLSFFRDGGD